MRNLTISACLFFLIFFGSTDESFALPQCPSSGVFHNCFGTWTWEDGDEYVGEWRDDTRHGQGTYNYANGDTYNGEWRNGKKHGQATFIFGPSSPWAGDKYVGEFTNGERTGHGTYYHSDGTVLEGYWVDNVFQGESLEFVGEESPFKIKGIALGDTTAPCSPTEYTYSDILGTPVRTAMECYSGTSTDEINVVFSLDDGSVVRVIRKQYLSQSDPDPSDILEAAIGFYGPPTTRDEGNWLALYDNSHSLEYYGQAVSASRNDHGIGLLINGFICADGSSGTKDCGGLGVYVIEYDLVDNQMFNKQVEVGKSLMEEAQKEKISNQEF